MTIGIANARTFLFVPGDRPERFGKAASSGADVVILDLEDGVAPGAKAAAREHVRAWLGQRHPLVIRINGVGTPWHDDDIAMVSEHPSAVATVMVPKAEDPRGLESVSKRLPSRTSLIPLIETAAGVMRAALICALPQVVRPAFGSLDLAAELGVDHRLHDALRYARSAVVLATAASGCGGPIDGVTTDFTDGSSLREDLEDAIGLGFTGKLCIHPRQVAVANLRLTPTSADIHWARGVIRVAQNGAVGVHDSGMIDRPVVLRAQAILARAANTA